MPRYIELEVVGRALNMNAQVSQQDHLLLDAVDAAEDMIDDWCGQTFAPASGAAVRLFRGTGTDRLDVGGIATATGLVVEVGQPGYWSALTLDTDFYIEPFDAFAAGQPAGVLRSASRWPIASAYPSVRITATWGWAEVPAKVKMAAQMQAIRLFQRKGAPFGVAGWDQVGSAVRVMRVDPDIADLLQQWLRLPGIA